MKKFLIIFIMGLFSITSFASLNQDDVLKTLKGRYQLKINNSDKANFVIRSSGKILMLSSNGELEYSEGEMFLTGSSNIIGPDGLPIANIVFGMGSDEETRDIHILLTVEEDWDGTNHEIKFISSFSTFNDGPNGYSSFEGANKIVLKKYNKQTKKYELIK
ncbi:MAG: hypothetical protein KC493_08495 [Bacteriovoracaceae bacterium]|nr:hypothetical protein [Bacteriovoracaceae bacterium]